MFVRILALVAALLLATPATGGTYLKGAQIYRVGMEGNANWDTIDNDFGALECLPVAFDSSIESFRVLSDCADDSATRNYIAFPFPVFLIEHRITSEAALAVSDDCQWDVTLDGGVSQVGALLTISDTTTTGPSSATGDGRIGQWVPANTPIRLQARVPSGGSLNGCGGALGRYWWDLLYIPGV